jgi:hypothetical protein
MSLIAWKYYSEITISNPNSTALIDYQVRIDLDSSNFDFSKANSDGSDIRFSEDNGNTTISYWLESWDNSGQTATIYTKVSSIDANSSKTIRMYYGNVDAASESNGDNVFEFFDDFEGTVLDASKWTVDSTVTSYSVANSKLTIDGCADSQNNVLKGIYTNSFPLQNGFTVEAKDFTWSEADTSNMPKVGIILTDGTSFDFPVSDIFYDAWGSDTAEKYAKIESNGYESGEASLSLSGTAQLKIIKLPNNDTQVYWDDTLILGTYNSTTTISNLYILVNKYSNNAFGTFTFDRIMIRKYIDTEPTYTISSAISNVNGDVIMFGANF